MVDDPSAAVVNGNEIASSASEYQCRFCCKDYNNKNSLKAHNKDNENPSQTDQLLDMEIDEKV